MNRRRMEKITVTLTFAKIVMIWMNKRKMEKQDSAEDWREELDMDEDRKNGK